MRASTPTVDDTNGKRRGQHAVTVARFRTDGGGERHFVRVRRMEFGATIQRPFYPRHQDVGVEQGRLWKWRHVGTSKVRGEGRMYSRAPIHLSSTTEHYFRGVQGLNALPRANVYLAVCGLHILQPLALHQVEPLGCRSVRRATLEGFRIRGQQR